MKIVLLIASLVFYSFWYPPYLIMLLVTVSINYLFLKRIYVLRTAPGDDPQAKNLLIVSLVFNLLLLFGFKYLHFMAGIFGYSLPADFKWALPLGISFYTFEAIACLVDTYNRANPFPPKFQDFLFFVSFFPHLIAGPILRIKTDWIHVMSPTRPSFKSFNSGLYLFVWGLCKKLLIADNLSIFVDGSFNNIENLSSLSAWIGIYAFAVQIYCDFSGYVDMALGLAIIFGIELPDNFNGPYLSQSITEFWRRWHITLSSWLRDYLYIPLGGNRKGEIRTFVNLMLTMLLGGLWHGANLTFVVWGGLHGLYLSIEKLLSEHFGLKLLEDKNKFSVRILFKQIICFHLVCLAWVFFRAANIEVAIHYIVRLLNIASFNIMNIDSFMQQSVIILGLALALHLLNRKFNLKNTISTWRLEFKFAFLVFTFILLLVMGVKQEVRFIYFDF
jgi:D-alanyl-lipoteichoic acid acyltransferase DltB (MBOAT superfamily)